MKDVIVSTAPCSRQGRRRTNIPFRVTTVHGATLPAGTVFTVDYAGGADRPTWSGQLANYSDVVFDPVNDSSPFGGRWGEIRFTLNEPMPANTTWDLTITMNIGNFVTGQRTSLTLTSSVPEENRITTNDSAFHEMYRDRCRS